MKRFLLCTLLLVLAAGLGTLHGKYVRGKNLVREKERVLSVSNTAFSEVAFLAKTEEFNALKKELEKTTGTFGLYVKDLSTKHVYELNPTEEFYGASLYKLPVALTIFRKIDLGELNTRFIYTYTPDDFAGGTGILYHYPIGTTFSLEYLLEVLLKESDNIAQNILLRVVNDNDVLTSFRGLTGTINDYVLKNMTTPQITAEFLEKLYTSNYLTVSSKEKLFEILSDTSFDNEIHAGLDENLTFAHKIGNWGTIGSWHDCGIVLGQHELVVCLMSKQTTFENFLNVSKGVGEFVTALVL